jgi:hypothetical protein
MKRGARALPPAIKQERGTYRPHRDDGRTEIDVLAPDHGHLASPHGLPQQPDWLTEAGKEVWLDNVGRVASNRMVTEADSDMFASWCCLQGAIVQAWRSGTPPPAAHLMESRRMAEQFGIFGRKSRVMQGVSAGDGTTSNPFAKLRK